MQPMSTAEVALRQSLELINATIHDLCVRRDMIASQLPDSPKNKDQKTGFGGMEIKLGGGKLGKKQC